MQATTTPGSRKPVPAGTRLGRAALLALPSALLALLASRHPEAGWGLWAGVAAFGLAALVAFLAGGAGREPAGPQLILLNAAALIWLLVALPQADGAPGRERALCEWDSQFPGYGMHLRSVYRDGWLCTVYEPSTAGQPNGLEEVWGDKPVCVKLQSSGGFSGAQVSVSDDEDDEPAAKPARKTTRR